MGIPPKQFNIFLIQSFVTEFWFCGWGFGGHLAEVGTPLSMSNVEFLGLTLFSADFLIYDVIS